MTARPKVLILGGGFAGLETAFTLRHRHAIDADVTLVSDRDRFLYQPNLVYVPFGGGLGHGIYVPVRRALFRRDITYLKGRVAVVDPALRRVNLVDGTSLPYDFLVIATGAAGCPDEVPGLGDHAATIDSLEHLRELGVRIRRLVATARLGGGHHRVLFLVPPGCTEPGPLYKTAFLLETQLTRLAVRGQVDLHWATYEQRHLEEYGLHDQVTRELGKRGIAATTGVSVDKVIHHAVEFENGTSQEFDLLVSSSPVVPAVECPALPTDLRGFLRTEPVTRQVRHHPEIYAPGDAGDTPTRQAFPALVQAGIVADMVASRIRPGERVAVSRLMLESVRMSPLWTLGAHLLRTHVSMRFRAGLPFWPGIKHHDRTSR